MGSEKRVNRFTPRHRKLTQGIQGIIDLYQSKLFQTWVKHRDITLVVAEISKFLDAFFTGSSCNEYTILFNSAMTIDSFNTSGKKYINEIDVEEEELLNFLHMMDCIKICVKMKRYEHFFLEAENISEERLFADKSKKK